MKAYLHLLNWPFALLHLDGQAYADQVEYAQLLHDGSEVQRGLDNWHKNHQEASSHTLTLNLPHVTPSSEIAEVPVIELFLKS
jgi:alpha-L-fucosidase